MKLSIALSTSLASYACSASYAGIKHSGRTNCKTGSNCILNLRKIRLSNGQFIEIGEKRVKNVEKESEFCIGYGLSRFQLSEQTSTQDTWRYQQEQDKKNAGFNPICIADNWHQSDYQITWKNTGTIGCYNNISKCGSADTFCCSAYDGQDKNKDCPLEAQRAAIQTKNFNTNVYGHVCVKRIMSLKPAQITS